jgi:serine/threonine protein kinase
VLTEYLPGGDLFSRLNESLHMQTVLALAMCEQSRRAGGPSGIAATATERPRRLSQIGFSDDQVVYMLAEIIVAIRHLHMHGFLHRDIKVRAT